MTPNGIEWPLAGGNVTPVSRRGDTVLRASGPWTPTVHAVLGHARAAGLDWVPEPLGVEEGREVLTFVDGVVPQYPMPEWVWEPSVLVEAARMLRAWHDATAGFVPSDATWRLPVHEPVEVICHNDFAPYNLVFDPADSPSLVGAIDFDTMSPGPRVWDIAYLAYRLVPSIAEEGPQPAVTERDRRLRTLLSAYGTDHSPAEVLLCMVDRLVELAEFTERNAAAGRPELFAHAVRYRKDAVHIRSCLSGT